MTYILGDPNDLSNAAKSSKIRVNGKYFPRDTQVGIPKPLETYKKTTMVQVDDESEWTMIENRVPSKTITALGGQYEKCLIFLQEPRYYIDAETGETTDVAFNAVELMEEHLQEIKGVSVGDLMQDKNAEINNHE